FFSSRRRHTRSDRDWSSDVCSSDLAVWEPQIRLLDRIGQAFGIFSPRSLAELEDQATRLPQVTEQFQSYSNAWKATLGSLAEARSEERRVGKEWRTGGAVGRVTEKR